MKLSFLTNAIVKGGVDTMEKVALWAENHGFQALEVGPTLPLDEEAYGAVIDGGKVDIAALIYCRNFLSTDTEEAALHISELKRRIQFAGKLGIPVVVTSTGIDKSVEEGVYDLADSIRKTPARSLDKVERVFTPVLELADKCGVKIAFENCPLMGNTAISPVMWRLIFERLDSKNAGLAFDPSHLVWQYINPYECIPEFADRIFHFHAKDTEVDAKLLGETGFLTDFRWWKYRIPGAGQIDWTRLRDQLLAADYKGVVSIEHEDPDYEGSFELVEKGLIKGQAFLDKLFNS